LDGAVAPESAEGTTIRPGCRKKSRGAQILIDAGGVKDERMTCRPSLNRPVECHAGASADAHSAAGAGMIVPHFLQVRNSSESLLIKQS
jgi:hypothetical protein